VHVVRGSIYTYGSRMNELLRDVFTLTCREPN